MTSMATERKGRLERETFAGVHIDDGQQAVRSARFIRKTVVHEVKAPDLIGCRNDGARLTDVRAFSAPVRFLA